MPVIETGVGNCHVYVDAAADLDVALAILIDAKVSRPSVCNAAETVLVHSAVADEFVPRAPHGAARTRRDRARRRTSAVVRRRRRRAGDGRRLGHGVPLAGHCRGRRPVPRCRGRPHSAARQRATPTPS